MQLGFLPKSLALIGGLAFLGMSALCFLIAGIGTFEQGKAATILSGIGLIFAALPMLALPFSLRAARALLALFLVLFSTLMVIAAFNPPVAVTEPGIYQVAAVALAVLVIFRLVLAWRRKAAPVRT